MANESTATMRTGLTQPLCHAAARLLVAAERNRESAPMMRKMAAELLLVGEIGRMPQCSVHGFAARHGPSQPAWFA